MKKRKLIALAIIIEGCIVPFTGCRNDLKSNRTDAETVDYQTETENDNETGLITEIETEIQTSDNTETDATYINVPKLPEQGSKLDDFVPEKWEIIDSVELDYNEDGITDYVGVLETESVDMQASPRILFAIASNKSDSYHLDFQDVNLIRRSDEGDYNISDPYDPLTAEGLSFTTHVSTGKWSEDYTYTFRDNAWWLTSAVDIDLDLLDYLKYFSKNDWESGIGIRTIRSNDWDGVEECKVEYEISLDEPLTLEQAGMRWWLTPEHITDWEVTTISFCEGVELSEDMVKLPGDSYINYCDEDYALYSFSNNNINYIAMYSWKDKALSVLAKEDADVGYLKLYKGKIYYSVKIKENIAQTTSDGNDCTTEVVDVGERLKRMELDATGQETIFEYRYPNEQEIKENRMSKMIIRYEICGDKIIIQVNIERKLFCLFYRINTDGSGLEEIGRMYKGDA